MFFKLPFRGLIRKPSADSVSTAESRRRAIIKTKELASDLALREDIKILWHNNDHDKIKHLCQLYLLEIDESTYISSIDLFIQVTNTLKNQFRT